MALVPDPEVVARVKAKWKPLAVAEPLVARWVDDGRFVKRQKARPAGSNVSERASRKNETAPFMLYANGAPQRIVTVENMVGEVLLEWVNRDLTTTGTVEAFYRQFHPTRAGARSEDVRKIIGFFKVAEQEVAIIRKERAAKKAAKVAELAKAGSVKKSRPVTSANVSSAKKKDGTPKGPTPNSLNDSTPVRKFPTALTRLNSSSKSVLVGMETVDTPESTGQPTKKAFERGNSVSSIGRSQKETLEEDDLDMFQRPPILENPLHRENFFSLRDISLSKRKVVQHDFSVKPVLATQHSDEMELGNHKNTCQLIFDDVFPKSADPILQRQVSEKVYEGEKPLVSNNNMAPAAFALPYRSSPPRTDIVQRRQGIGRELGISQAIQLQGIPEATNFLAPRKAVSEAKTDFPDNCSPPSQPRHMSQLNDPNTFKRRSQSPIKERIGLFGRHERDYDPLPEIQHNMSNRARPPFSARVPRSNQHRVHTDTYRPQYTSAPNARPRNDSSRTGFGGGLGSGRDQSEGYRGNNHGQDSQHPNRGFGRGWDSVGERGHARERGGGYPRNNGHGYEGDHRMEDYREHHRR